MANYTVSRAKHATLVASTVDQVTFSVEIGEVEVMNRGTTAGDIYFSVGTTGLASPTVAGDNTYAVPAGMALMVGTDSSQAVVVKLISSAAQPYSVTRAD